MNNHSEIVKFNKLIYSINEEDKTASVVNNDNANGDVFIPKLINFNNQEYNIISIKEGAFRNLKSIYSLSFPFDSKVEKIEKDVFTFSSIESLFIPKSVKELQEGFCRGTSKLKLITVMPSNNQLMNIDNKMIVGKSNLMSEEYDNLLFVRRDVKSLIIPSFIKRIGRYAFSESCVENIFVPSQVREICEGSFFNCKKLEHVEISNKSELQTIEPLSFLNTSISSINIPSSVKHLLNVFYDESAKVSEMTSIDNSIVNIEEFENVSELENNNKETVSLIVNPKTNEKYVQTVIKTFFETNEERNIFISNFNVMKRMTKHPGMMKIVSFEEHPHPTIINEYGIVFTLKEMIAVKKNSISASTVYKILFGLLKTIEFLNHHNIYVEYLESNKIYIDENFWPRLLVSFINKNKKLIDEQNREKLRREISSYFKIIYEMLTGRVYKEDEHVSAISTIKQEWLKEFLQKYLTINKTNEVNKATISNIIEELELHKREIIGNDEKEEIEVSKYENEMNRFISEYLNEIQEKSADNIFYLNIYKEITTKNNQIAENKEEISKEQKNLELMLQNPEYLSKGDVIDTKKEELAKHYKQAADKGDVESMFKYAFMLDEGYGIEKNKKEASKYYKKAADEGHTKSMYKYGFMLANKDGIEENRSEAARYFKLAADRGHVESMFSYGFMLLKGDGVESNKREAAHYYKLSADLGHVDSMLTYAVLLSKGEGIEKNHEEASRYYKLAADQGDANAMFIYGFMVDKGELIEQDKVEAARYYKLAAEEGDQKAMYKYAVMLSKGDGISEDKEESARYYKLAADKGYVKAMFKYANMLSKGDGIEKNKVEASQYYKKAADHGGVVSMFNYAVMVDKGDGIEIDKEEALRYYKLASEHGYASAMYNYAIMLSEGDGIEANEEESARYFKLAADKGHTRAMEQYAQLLFSGGGVEINWKESARLFKLIADQGDAEAKFRFACRLHKGDKILKNTKEAARYFKIAADQGHGRAIFKYASMNFDGDGIEVNKEVAARYFKLLADKGDNEAMEKYQECISIQVE